MKLYVLVAAERNVLIGGILLLRNYIYIYWRGMVVNVLNIK